MNLFNQLAGALLLNYILFHSYLHGKVFITLNFVIDTVFEITYCLFPLVFLTTTQSTNIFDLTVLGLLGQQNGFVITQSLFAMIMLVRKCILLMRDLDPIHIAKSFWHKVTKHIKTDHLQPWITIAKYSKKVEKSGFGNSELYRLVVARHETIDTISPRTSIALQKIQSKRDLMRQRSKSKSKHDHDLALNPPELVADTSVMSSSEHQQQEHGYVATQTVSPTFTSVASISNEAPRVLRPPPVAVSPSLSNQVSNEIEIIDDDFALSQTAQTIASISPTGEAGGSHTTAMQVQRQEKSGRKSISICIDSCRHAWTVDVHTVQCQRKSFVIGCGLSFILAGLGVLISVLSFIENDYYNKCINISDESWLIQHPELEYFDSYCTQQVVHLFNDYPCNCRLLSVVDADSLQFTPSILELSVINYNNLEGISMRGDNAENNDLGNITDYYFSANMFDNLPHLVLLSVLRYDIRKLDQSIEKLSNLELLVLQFSNAEIDIPFDSISKLSKLKALVLFQLPLITNGEIPSSVCNLKEIKYFESSFTNNLASIPFDCIATQWKRLNYLRLDIFPFITDLDAQFWELPELEFVWIEVCDLDPSYFQFDTFTKFSNSLNTVALGGNERICETGNIIINNTEYTGFGYLNLSDPLAIDSDLLQFIERFDPCSNPCGDASVYTCLNALHSNGVCDSNCNSDECNYDGGDCNQLCNCSYTLWFNDECDNGCDNDLCNYDFYECGSYIDANDTCDFNGTCYTLWTFDDWCDSSCNVTECDFDGGKCISCQADSTCSTAEGFIIGALASQSKPRDLMTVDEVCDNYGAVQTLLDIDETLNCTQAFDFYDINKNGYIGFYEALLATKEGLGFTDAVHWDEKKQQLDCSFCLANSSLYYK